MRDVDDDVTGDEPGRISPWIHGFIAVFLVVQVLAPVSYYLGDDPADERFAWRMFSMKRAERCRVIAREGVDDQPREIPLVQVIHQGWRNAMGRRRLQVIEAFGAWRCEDPQVSSVVVERQCIDAKRRRLPPDILTHPCAPNPGGPP